MKHLFSHARFVSAARNLKVISIANILMMSDDRMVIRDGVVGMDTLSSRQISPRDKSWIKRFVLYNKKEDKFFAVTIWKSLPGYIWLYTRRHEREWVYKSWEEVAKDFEISCVQQNY